MITSTPPPPPMRGRRGGGHVLAARAESIAISTLYNYITECMYFPRPGGAGRADLRQFTRMLRPRRYDDHNYD